MRGKIWFDFSVPKEQVKKLFGYVIADWEKTESGEKIVKPVDVVIVKAIAVRPDWKRLGELAVENAI